jgi:outer membrane receptor protein involved in Fe transport
MTDRSHVVLVSLSLILLAPVALAATTVSGTVTAGGEAVAAASVFLGDSEVATDAAGGYSIADAPAGAQTLIVFKEGYRTETRPVTVPGTGSLSEDFQLAPDLLYSDTLVVTGTRNPQTKRESSVAITTLTNQQVEARAPRSTADLMKVVPGFYVESSGGEVGGNLFARGLPADGSFRYVALMEDGMPVFDSTELSFVNADIFVRVDENISEVEAVRGGNAALYGSNAPGGVINFISKTGGSAPQTTLKILGGTDGLGRVDFNTNGPLAQNWNYSLGGFYRYDEGVRDPGFPASTGGQIKFNLTRNFERGFGRIYFKYLNDRNIFYLPLPFQAGKNPSYVNGFPFDGTLTTAEGNHVQVPRPNQQGLLDLPLDDGQRQEGITLMAEFSTELGGGWLLNNTARYMDLDHSWNAVVPFDLVHVDDFAQGFLPAGGSYQYSFTNHSDAFSTANDLLLTAGLWHVEKPMTDFSDQFQLTKTFGSGKVKHNFSLGGYAGTYEAGNTWFFNDILTDVRNQPRFVDLTVYDAQGNPTRVTDNGFRRFGSLFVDATGNVDLFAFFAGDQIQLNDKLRLDVGGRWETDTFRQTEALTTNFNLGDPTTLADDAVGGTTGRNRRVTQTFDDVAFSVGVNYLVNDTVAVWGRGSTGYKMPNLDNYLFGGADLKSESLIQVEVGTRIGTPRWGLNTSAYLQRLSDFPSQDVRVVNGQTVFVTDFVGQAKTYGLEAELVAEPIRHFKITASATLQHPEYTDFNETGTDAQGNPILLDRSGKRVRRIPQEIFDVTLAYDWGRFGLAGNWNYIGQRFSNVANTIELPAFDVSTFTGTYKFSSGATLEAAIVNAFNSKGLTEGNPRLDENSAAQGAVFLARPVLPRRVTLGMRFEF